jgi:hypothetical protein
MGKRTVIEVGALSPQGVTAAKVLGKGVHWKPMLHVPAGFVREEEGTLPTRPIPFSMKAHEDLTGKRFGKFVVKGLGIPSKPARWVVRCDCGAYEHRKTNALLTIPVERSQCSHCDYLTELKLGLVPNRGPFNKAETASSKPVDC